MVGSIFWLLYHALARSYIGLITSVRARQADEVGSGILSVVRQNLTIGVLGAALLLSITVLEAVELFQGDRVFPQWLSRAQMAFKQVLVSSRPTDYKVDDLSMFFQAGLMPFSCSTLVTSDDLVYFPDLDGDDVDKCVETLESIHQ